MKKKLTQAALKQMLHNGAPLDAYSLEKIIFEEAAKPAGKADTELIDAAMDMLLKIDGIDSGEIPQEVPFAVKPASVDKQREIFFNYRIPKKLKNFVSACAVLLMVIAINTFSTLAFGFNFTEELLSWTDKEVVISVENSEEEEKTEIYNEIVRQMAQRGNWNFLLPDYLPDNMELMGYSVSPTDTDVTVSIFLQSETGETVSIVSHNYINEMVMEENSAVRVTGRYTLGNKKTVGGHTVFEILGEEGNAAVFTDNLSIYVVTTSYDKIELNNIIRGMIL